MAPHDLKQTNKKDSKRKKVGNKTRGGKAEGKHNFFSKCFIFLSKSML